MPYDDIKLIELLKVNDVLYNKNHPLANTNHKKLVWEKIAEDMGLSVDRVEKRYRALRDRFVRYKRAVLTKGPENNYDLGIMDRMEFLTPYIFIKSSGGKITWEGSEANLCISTDPLRVSASARDSEDSDGNPSKSSKKSKRRSRAKRRRRADSSSMDSNDDNIPNSKNAKLQTDSSVKKYDVNTHSRKNHKIKVDDGDSNDYSNIKANSSFDIDDRYQSDIDYNADSDEAFCDAVNSFMKLCRPGERLKENKALHGFGQMIIATISEMNITKQAKTMALVTETVMQMKMEDDN